MPEQTNETQQSSNLPPFKSRLTAAEISELREHIDRISLSSPNAMLDTVTTYLASKLLAPNLRGLLTDLMNSELSEDERRQRVITKVFKLNLSETQSVTLNLSSVLRDNDNWLRAMLEDPWRSAQRESASNRNWPRPSPSQPPPSSRE